MYYRRRFRGQKEIPAECVTEKEASMHRSLRATAVVMIVIAAAAVELAAQVADADPVVGKWELNVANEIYPWSSAEK